MTIVRLKEGGRYSSIFLQPQLVEPEDTSEAIAHAVGYPSDARIQQRWRCLLSCPLKILRFHAMMQEIAGPENTDTRRRRRATEIAGRDWS
jgi:hypothetical protein